MIGLKLKQFKIDGFAYWWNPSQGSATNGDTPSSMKHCQVEVQGKYFWTSF